MVLVKFVLILFGIYLAFWLFFKLFGKALSRWAIKMFVRRAQRSMDEQSRQYHQYAQDYSPFEENVYIEDDVRVSIRKGSKPDPGKDRRDISNLPVEEVEFEYIE
jgi:hypothetical protein